MNETHKTIIAIGFILLFLVGVTALLYQAPMNQQLRWNEDHPELTQKFEDKCNQAFGYDWEYDSFADWPPSESIDGDTYRITCSKSMGFAAVTYEDITVTIQ